jgi:hypothetical protein
MAMIVTMIVTLTVAAAMPSGAIAKSYTMTGKISAINLSHRTVVIEVPMVSKMFTVGGPLAGDAKLTKDMQPADLNDFMVGERVTVKWHSTPAGHVIDQLAAR